MNPMENLFESKNPFIETNMQLEFNLSMIYQENLKDYVKNWTSEVIKKSKESVCIACDKNKKPLIKLTEVKTVEILFKKNKRDALEISNITEFELIRNKSYSEVYFTKNEDFEILKFEEIKANVDLIFSQIHEFSLLNCKEEKQKTDLLIHKLEDVNFEKFKQEKEKIDLLIHKLEDVNFEKLREEKQKIELLIHKLEDLNYEKLKQEKEKIELLIHKLEDAEFLIERIEKFEPKIEVKPIELICEALNSLNIVNETQRMFDSIKLSISVSNELLFKQKEKELNSVDKNQEFSLLFSGKTKEQLFEELLESRSFTRNIQSISEKQFEIEKIDRRQFQKISRNSSNLEIFGNKKKNNVLIVPSYYYNFEIRSSLKQKYPNCEVKEVYFSIFKEIHQEIRSPIVSPIQTNLSEIFVGPKNFKIVSNNLNESAMKSSQITNISELNKSMDKKNISYSPLNNSKYYSHQKDLNKSEILNNDSSLLLTQNSELNSSLIANSKFSGETKKTDKIIEQLRSKLEIEFEKFERNEISSEKIFAIVKNELVPFRPLFISSKTTKDKVFHDVCKGTQSQINFLNKVFRNIVEESLKGIKPAMNNNLVSQSMIMKSPIKDKHVINDAGDYSKFVKALNDSKSPVRKLKAKDDKKIISKIQINNKSIHAKNNININIHAYKKDKLDYTELPYIK